MPDLISKAQRIAVFKRGMQSVPGARVDPAAVDKKGSTLNLIAAGDAAMAEEVERRAQGKLAALTLAGAQGAELDALGAERTFGLILRFGAAPSVIPLAISRPSGGSLLSGTVTAGTLVKAGAITFALDFDVPFGAGIKGPLTVTATATSAGEATNVAGSAVSDWADATTLFDTTLVVVATDNAAGGAETEKDADYRERIKAFPTTVRRGTLGAIEVGALSVDGIRQALASEVVDAQGFPTGLILLYVADINGQANEGLVRKVVQLGLPEYRPAGSVVRVIGSVPTFVPIVVNISYQSGFDTLAVRDQALAAIIAAVNRLGPSAPLTIALLLAALQSVPGTVVSGTSIVAPAGDLVSTAGQIFRTQASMVTFVT